MNATNNRSGGLRRRSVLARAMAMMLCLAVTAAGVVHAIHAHAAEHANSVVASIEAIDLADGTAGDAGHAVADSCTVAGGCHSWIAAAQACEWRAPEGGAAPAVTGGAPRGAPAALHRRPPKSLV